MFLHLPLISFLDEVYTEVVDMNVEDNMHDENMNDIFMHWSYEEIIYCSNVTLEHIDDKKRIIEDNMW